MLWHEYTKFKAVIVRADNPSQIHQVLPTRDTVAEVKLDILCFQHQCRCHKASRPTGCLRYTRVEPLGIHLTAYVENDRGSRSWLTSSTVVPLLPKDE